MHLIGECITVYIVALKDPSTYSSTYTLCGGHIPSHTTTIKYPKTGSMRSAVTCKWKISRPGETFKLILSELNLTEHTFSHTCTEDFLQIEGQGGGFPYCGRSREPHEFQEYGSATITLKTNRQNDLDPRLPDTGFVLKIVDTTGQGESQTKC